MPCIDIKSQAFRRNLLQQKCPKPPPYGQFSNDIFRSFVFTDANPCRVTTASYLFLSSSLFQSSYHLKSVRSTQRHQIRQRYICHRRSHEGIWRSGGKAPPIFNLAKWSASRSDRFTPG
jgi:hypothetical protein